MIGGRSSLRTEERGNIMAVRQLGDGWQCDFYAFKERIRKVFPSKKDAKAYEGKIKASIRENRYFDIKQDAFETFKELSKWYLSLEDVKRKKSYNRDVRSADKLKDFLGHNQSGTSPLPSSADIRKRDSMKRVTGSFQQSQPL
jgi:hypothetical protein